MWAGLDLGTRRTWHVAASSDAPSERVPRRAPLVRSAQKDSRYAHGTVSTKEQASSNQNPVHGIAQRSLLTPSIAASQPAFPRSPQAGRKPLAARDSHGESASAQQPRILGRLACVEKRLCGTPGLFSRPVSTKVCSRHLFVRAVGLGAARMPRRSDWSAAHVSSTPGRHEELPRSGIDRGFIRFVRGCDGT